MDLPSHSLQLLYRQALPSTKPIAIATFPFPIYRFPFKSLTVTGLSSSFWTSIITMRKASFEIKDGGGESVSETDTDDDEENSLFDKFPLDPKLQQKLEHKMKMKLAKKIRIRRKKLIRKRRMRKKGHWPPSKAYKLKDI